VGALGLAALRPAARCAGRARLDSRRIGVTRRLFPWLLLALMVLPGCGLSVEEIGQPAVLKMLVLPGRPHKQIEATYGPLAEYLSRKLGLPCELVIPESYERAVELFHRGDAQLANLGGVVFVGAHAKDRAVPLVMRDSDLAFSSSFIARTTASGHTIKDFRGRTFAFGPKLSTSGHLMPRHFLVRQNIVPEQFFSAVRYADNHDTTAAWVRDGVVDLGVVNSLALSEMFHDGLLRRDAVRVLWETPTYPDYVWVAQGDLSAQFRSRVRAAFLDLSNEEPGNAAILAALQAKAFLPAIDSDFASLEGVATENGLLD
jgi:phosphonate transport system substrate-binding protein